MHSISYDVSCVHCSQGFEVHHSSKTYINESHQQCKKLPFTILFLTLGQAYKGNLQPIYCQGES